MSAGTKLGPYEILAPIGAGGMGEVYRAKDPRLGREVAIKVLPASFAQDKDRLARFESEARAASALNHPNIITIHEIGAAGGDVVHRDGVRRRDEPARARSASGALPTKRLLDVAVQIAEGLAKAHSAGIVHRDLKPENVMVSKDGFVKLLDFGLAKLFVAPTDQATHAPTAIHQETAPGTVMGTVGYMSPEQASGRPVDFRSDQFSLGSILYEMATGQRAFQKGTGAQTLAAIIQDEPEPVAQVNPKAPAPFRWIVERCHAKDPDERYASTRDLARDLKSVREHLGEVTSTASGVTGVVEPTRRRARWPLALAAVLVAGLLGLFAGRRTGAASAADLPAPHLPARHRQHGALRARRQHGVLHGRLGRCPVPGSTPLRPGNSGVLAVCPLPRGEPAVDLVGGRDGDPRRARYGRAGSRGHGTLARVPLRVARPRRSCADVTYADWVAGDSDLAVVHRAPGRTGSSIPIGKVLFETAGWIQDPRFSADGKRSRSSTTPRRDADGGGVAIVDLAGKKTDLATGLGDRSGARLVAGRR